MKNFIPVFFFALLLLTCRKDPQVPASSQCPAIDTIKPLDYYPIYPGSYWTYVRNDTDTITSYASATYVKHSYWDNTIVTDSSTDRHYSDTVYVPFLDNQPVYGYNRIQSFTPPFFTPDQPWPILSETVGFRFEREWIDPRYGDFREKVIVDQKTVNADLDSVLILKGHWVYGPHLSERSYQVFTKNIGLTFHCIVDTVTMDTVYKSVLTDYRINR